MDGQFSDRDSGGDAPFYFNDADQYDPSAGTPMDFDALLAPPPIDKMERLAMTALTQDDPRIVRSAVASLCRLARVTGGAGACDMVTRRVLDATTRAEHVRDAVNNALGALCEASDDLALLCAIGRPVDEWAQRYPALTLWARTSPGGNASLATAAISLRRVYALRKCALYALRTGVATIEGTLNALPPYGAATLGGLEQWARDWQSGASASNDAVAVPPLPLAGPLGPPGVPSERMFPVLPNVAEAIPMGHNGLVARAYLEGPASLYGQSVENREALAQPFARSVTRALRDLLVRGLVATDSADAAPSACMGDQINIFVAYPGTRPAIARHLRDDIESRTVDLGVLLALPGPDAASDPWAFGDD